VRSLNYNRISHLIQLADASRLVYKSTG